MVGRGPYPLPICWLTPFKRGALEGSTDHTFLLARVSIFEGMDEVIAVDQDFLMSVSDFLSPSVG